MTEPTGTTDDSLTCTLSDAARAERKLEWADLGALKLTSERIGDGVASTFPLSMLEAIEDLASRELGCCGSWLGISTSVVADVVRLELTTTNPDGLATILAMSGVEQ